MRFRLANVFYPLLLLIAFFWTARAMAESGPVAFVEHAYPESPHLADVISIERNGRPIRVDEHAPLYQRDRIFVLNASTTVTVRVVATHVLIPVRQHVAKRNGEADMTVPDSAIPGLTGQAWRVLVALTIGADRSGGDIAAASRRIATTCFNSTGKSNEPIAFDMPMLSSERSFLTPGPRQLFVSWRGGAPPFKVTLSDARTGDVLAHSVEISDACATRLPSVIISAGRQYKLTVTDSNNVREEETNILGSEKSPLAPRELTDAVMDDEARRLYSATWLTLQNGGIWSFEAAQRVASMKCTPARQEWLTAFGSEEVC